MAAPTRITSRQHPVVQRCRQAASKRRDSDPVVLDGEHLLTEALATNLPIELVCALDPTHPLVARAASRGAVVYAVTDAVLAAASPVRTPSGLLALARWTPATLGAALDAKGGLAVALLDVQDPGNLGAVIRSADALGAASCLALGRTAHPAGWKAIRGAMGSTFRIPVATATLDECMAAAKTRRLPVVATTASGGSPLETADLSAPAVLILGSEGAGLPADVVMRADRRVTIPMSAGIESINVAVAAALLLYEARRRPRTAGP